MRAEARHDEHLFVVVAVLVRFQTTWGGGVLVGGRVGVRRAGACRGWGIGGGIERDEGEIMY